MAAVREVLPGRANQTTQRAPLRGERLLVLGGLLCLVAVAIALRLAPIVFQPSMNWGDEIFQTTEPAHRLVYGYGLVPWEFQLGMRSWLLPGVVAGLIEIARIIGDGPDYYLSAIAVGLGLLACAPIVCVFLWCRRPFGLAAAFVAAGAVAVAPELVYFGGRTLNEVVAAHLLVIALYLIEPEPIQPGHQVGRRRRHVAAGMLLGLICLLRLQLAPAAMVIALWPASTAWRLRLPPLIVGGVAALLFGAAFDWLTLGYPLASVWRNLFYNVYLNVSSGFSVEPWFYYVLGEFGVWLAAAPIVLVLVAIGTRQMPALLAACVTVVAVHSAIAHKEYRFIYPAVVCLMVLAAIGLAQLTCRGARWLRQRDAQQGLAAAVCALVLLAGWATLAFGAWSHGVLALLRDRAHDELMAMSFVHAMPAPCGVGLYGEEAWVRYGGYTYLHRPLPLYWPKDETELAAAAAGFDTLLSDTAPPPQLGFTPVRCFGRVCVARRPGRCEARPSPAMWFPRQLRGMMPAQLQFEPVPARARPDGAPSAQQ